MIFTGEEEYSTLTMRVREVRVLSPFVMCQKSKKWLFLRKARLITIYQAWDHEMYIWLSNEEFMFMKLRGDFDEC